MTSKLTIQLYQSTAEITNSFSKIKIAVLGDLCLDSYWQLADQEELSIETGLPVRRVAAQHYSLGGAGNVMANLHALGIGRISAFGIVGDDLFGQELKKILAGLGADVGGVLTQRQNWQTYVYAKPILKNKELNRIDFGGFNRPEKNTIKEMAALLEKAAGEHDVLIVNQQIKEGLYQEEIIQTINRLAEQYPRLIILVDSRHFAASFGRVIYKMNMQEAARLTGRVEPSSRDDAREIVTTLSRKSGKPVFVTRGDRGVLVGNGNEVHEIPGTLISPPIDPVGAGDTALSAIAAALGSDTSPQGMLNAGWLANLAASVVLKKLHVTGTATPAEIENAARNMDYVYEPELAADPRQAAYAPGTDIEIVRTLPEKMAIRHAIFDHDGTISTLREGWEQIMEPMMVKAIMGHHYATASLEQINEVTHAARAFIDRTTGIQTLVQMRGLIELVRSFGHVPENDILDEHGYKRIYNDQLLKMVHQRVARLERGELSPVEFQIRNARLLLQKLHDAGVTLYLASGTDVQDVIAEAKALGYADLFGNRIFGAVGDITVEAKKLVLERIMKENQLSGSQLVTFGDGPVEMRETRRHDGIAVGIASDEARRFGLNLSKRSRLIGAGADLIVPDFGQLDQLLNILKIKKA